jgi:hypothetical protein
MSPKESQDYNNEKTTSESLNSSHYDNSALSYCGSYEPDIVYVVSDYLRREDAFA